MLGGYIVTWYAESKSSMESCLPTLYLFHRAQADRIVLLIFSLRRILTSPTSSPVSIAHAREQLRVTRFDLPCRR
jgi:hypothetical protein